MYKLSSKNLIPTKEDIERQMCLRVPTKEDIEKHMCLHIAANSTNEIHDTLVAVDSESHRVKCTKCGEEIDPLPITSLESEATAVADKIKNIVNNIKLSLLTGLDEETKMNLELYEGLATLLAWSEKLPAIAKDAENILNLKEAEYNAALAQEQIKAFSKLLGGNDIFFGTKVGE